MSNDSFLSRALNWLFKSGSTHDQIQSADASSVPEHRDEEQPATTSQPVTDHPLHDSQPVAFTPKNVMRALGVEILQDGEDGYYLVGFQGGVFVFCFEDDRLNVMYNDIVECSFSDSVKAAFVANDINGDYAVWSCYLRASKKGSSAKPIKICFSQMFALNGDFKTTTEFIHGVLTSAFSIGREFRAKFKEALNDDSNLANTLIRKDFVNKLELAKRLIEVGNFDKVEEEMPPASHLQLKSLAALFDDAEFGEAMSLKIMAQDQLDQLEGKEVVANFDLREYIRNHPQRDELETLTIVALFEKQDLIINLKRMPGSTAKSLFYLMNVMRSGCESDLFNRNHSTVSCRATVEIRLTTEQEDYWEVKYMIDEAKDKHSKNELSSMTDEQKMLLIQLTPNVQDDLYWGFKYFNEDCWFQSLFYFKRLFYNYNLPSHHEAHNDQILSDICLYIGIIYYHLRLNDRAYYYLDRSRKYNSIIASEWYVNCLYSLKDPVAVPYIKEMLQIVQSDLAETSQHLDPNTKEEYYKYYLFLKRKLVQTFMMEQKLNEAETILNMMLENQESVDFVKNELENIRVMREEAKEKKNSEEQSHS